MKKKAVIFGINDFAEILLYQLRKDRNNQPEICGFTVNREYVPVQPVFCGLPVIAFEDLPLKFPITEFGVFVCIGYKRMNEGRRTIFEILNNLNYSILSFIHPSAQIDAEQIGKGTIIMQNTVIGEYCTMGDGNIFYPGSMLSHHSSIGNYNFFAVNACVAGHVSIGNSCFLGANSTVKNGVALADKTLVGANAYVVKDTEHESVIVPARSSVLSNKKSSDFL
jgi:sugar O-acyltransferase (sialic acid O-acetyltransferase NeuD family)